jgi:hypothetical protein
MKRFLTIVRLWSEEDGVIVSSELVLFSTVVVIGMLVGLQTVRDAVTRELGDFAMSIGTINQSYSFAGVTGHHSSTAGSLLADRLDDCDQPQPGFPTGCILVATATHEQ